MSNLEYKKLTEILMQDKKSEYSAFLIILLKELNNDINKVLRIVNIGITMSDDTGFKRSILKKSIYYYFITTIKEAIILANYKRYIEKDGFISAVKMSKTERFKLAGINRHIITRTFKKYKVEYNKRIG